MDPETGPPARSAVDGGAGEFPVMPPLLERLAVRTQGWRLVVDRLANAQPPRHRELVGGLIEAGLAIQSARAAVRDDRTLLELGNDALEEWVHLTRRLLTEPDGAMTLDSHMDALEVEARRLWIGRRGLAALKDVRAIGEREAGAVLAIARLALAGPLPSDTAARDGVSGLSAARGGR